MTKHRGVRSSTALLQEKEQPFVTERDQGLPPSTDPAGDMERLQKNLRAEHDRNLRTRADFTTYRHRIEREGNKLVDVGKRDIILTLLEIVDDVEKTLHWEGNEKESVARGLHIMHHKLLGLLKSHGVLPFESVGTAFNPDRHEAVDIVEHEGSEEGTIVDELRRGYLWKNKTLRAAQVRVAG